MGARDLAPSRSRPSNSHLSNDLLASLAPTDIGALLPQLRSVDLPQEMVLFEVGQTVNQVFFPHAGIVSLVVKLASGDMIESTMIGWVASPTTV